MDMGRVLLTEQYIADRARVAVRSAVVNSWDATAVSNFLVYGSPSGSSSSGSDGQNQNQTPAPGFLGLTTSQVTFTTFPDSGVGDAHYQIAVSGIPLFSWVPYLAGQYTAPTVVATAPVQSLGVTN
jgi:hypothetical protein